MNDLPKIPNTFTETIASREFDLKNSAKTKKLIVEIGLPINDVETVADNAWRCPIRLTYDNSIINKYACGHDSYQALSTCMNQLVKREVEGLAKAENALINLFGAEYNFKDYPY